MSTQEKLQERIQELQRNMYSMECSDDSLYSNRNGNLPTYQSWQKELSTLRKRLTLVKENT